MLAGDENYRVFSRFDVMNGVVYSIYYVVVITIVDPDVHGIVECGATQLTDSQWDSSSCDNGNGVDALVRLSLRHSRHELLDHSLRAIVYGRSVPHVVRSQPVGTCASRIYFQEIFSIT